MTYEQLKAAFLAELPNYLTPFGLLVQKDGDSGDSCQRMGTIATLLDLIDDSDLAAEAVRAGLNSPTLVKADWGYFRRSNIHPFWGYDPRCTSRDQLATMKMALGYNDLLLTLVRQTLRLGFHQNYYDPLENRYHLPDLMIPTEVSVYARGLLKPLSYLVTWFFDIGYGFDALLRSSTGLNIWSQDNMLALGLLHACHRYPSPTAKLIMMGYKKTDFMARLELYHGVQHGNNGCLPLLFLFKMAFLKLENYSG